MDKNDLYEALFSSTITESDIHQNNIQLLELLRQAVDDDDTSHIKLEPVIGNELHTREEILESTTVQAKEADTESQCFHCALCNRKFTSKMNLVRHLKISSNNPFKCNICDYKCLRKCVIQEHKKSHIKEDSCQCKVLHCKCMQENCLHQHVVRIHTGEKRFKCNLCDYKFVSKSHFQEHLRTHTGEKPFKCSICEYKCIRKCHMQEHLRIHTGVTPFKCNICEHKYISNSNLQRHLRTHTGEKPFKCNSCNYKCIENTDLQRHLKIHTGEKPFKCNICEYKSVHKSNLKLHLKAHTGEKPFKCNVCNYKSIRKSHLNRHLKTHTYR